MSLSIGLLTILTGLAIMGFGLFMFYAWLPVFYALVGFDVGILLGRALTGDAGTTAIVLGIAGAFILGVAPLAVATGAGAEMRQSLGTAVLFGMLGVTCFGLLFTPAFYTVVRRFGHKQAGGDVAEVAAHPVSPAPAR